MLPMRDGIRLATVVFRPRAEGRYPTLLVRSPYAAAIPDQFKPVHSAQFKKNYVLVMQNERGSEWSEGDFGFLSRSEYLRRPLGSRRRHTGFPGQRGGSGPVGRHLR